MDGARHRDGSRSSTSPSPLWASSRASRVEDGCAEVVFRLPTFWCSANFAFLMATDMRCAIEQLPEIASARIRLVDHFAARRINRGRGWRASASPPCFPARPRPISPRSAARSGSGPSWGARSGCCGRRGRPRHRGRAGHHHGGARGSSRAEDPEIRPAALRYLAMRRHEGRWRGSRRAGLRRRWPGFPCGPTATRPTLRALKRVRGAAEANAEMCRIYLEARIAHPAPGCEPENREDDPMS